MTIPKHKSDRLIALANVAIAAANHEKSRALTLGAGWLVEDYDRAIQNFQAIKEQAENGTLQPSNGAGLGISRALSEWNVSDEFYDAGCNLEEYFRSEWHA